MKKKQNHGKVFRQWLTRIVALTIALLMLLTLAPTLFTKLGERRAAKKMEDPLPVEGLTVENVPVPGGLDCRPGTQRTIRTIVIHETANTAPGANADAHGRYLAGGGSGTTGWHYTVDDQKAVHHIPDAEVAYHAGSTEGNRDGIGIEICVNEDGDFDKALDNAARLTGALMVRYGLSIDDVRQHHDYMDKNCPATIRDTGRWDEFLALAENYAAETAE